MAIDDEDDLARPVGGSLPEESGLLIATDEEYKEHLSTLERGKGAQRAQKPTKSDDKKPPDKKNTPETVEPDKFKGKNVKLDVPPPRPDKGKNVTRDVPSQKPDNTKSDYCQPTSSKVLVEDLRTDEEEEKFLKPQVKLDLPEEEVERPKTFWDRPVPKPQYEWIHDTRMPKEWNEMVYAMRALESSRMYTEGEYYREATPDEISEPVDFDYSNYSNSNSEFTEYLRKMSVHQNQPLLGSDDSEAKFKKLANKFRKPTPGPSIKEAYVPPYKPDKGKKPMRHLTQEDYPRLRENWRNEYADIVGGTRDELPPWREVNHEINLIDDKKRYTYHLPRCPNSLKEELHEKINRYVNAGWWEPLSVPQAAPMLCLPKKDGHLRTVVDARQRNDNTVKDVTPLPDQEVIREDVARGKIRSKIDLSDAYEQVRVKRGDVWKTAFATISGTYVSKVMQQGDCNAPATFQRLMTSIFRDVLGKFIHVYLDDMFIFSETIEEHEEHLREVFERLRKAQLYLKWSKCELYAERIDCLGHIIDDEGIHADADKLHRIREWRTPRNYNDIQRFVGLVNYLASFLPVISAYTGPLMSMTQNGSPFHWRPIHQKCFEMIKTICVKTPILKPIEPKKKDPIWLICDASKSGVGAMYGQGPTWQTCRPAGFMSKKFTPAQQNYAVHELETLAILESLIKWEDKLVGYKIHIITDHKALEFFKTQPHLSNRQRRWTDYMARFDFDITYVKGELNKVADCLSRYFESDTVEDVHDIGDYVRADGRIDPTGEDLPNARFQEISEHVVEVRAMREEVRRTSKRLQERQELRDIEAKEMAEAVAASKARTVTSVAEATAGDDVPPAEVEMTLNDALYGRQEDMTPPPIIQEDKFLKNIRKGYEEDSLFKLVLQNPGDYKGFEWKDNLIWHVNTRGDRVLCIPKDVSVIESIIDQAHRSLGHYGFQRTSEYIRRWYWWPLMVKHVKEFCKSCDPCQRSKGSTKKPMGKLHALPVPLKPWDSIGMDFVGPFPESKGYDYLWVIICRMTSMVHLIPVKTTMTASDLSWIYLREIVRLHGLPSSIVSDRDSKFTSKWWRELHKILGSKLLMSTSFHPQTDGQTERANRSVGQIFRTIVSNDQQDWVDKIDLTEFAINASISETTKFAPFELNGGYLPSMLREIRSDDAIPKGIREFAEQALSNLAEAHDAIIESRVFQTHYSNKRRREEPKIAKGDLVYLSTVNLNISKGRARKLCPKFIGPYKVLEAFPETSNYSLELPEALRTRRLHPKFHISLLRPHHANNDALFPNRAHPEPYDFGNATTKEWFVDDILGHRWDGRKLMLQLRWSLGDTTWEPLSECNKLMALDRYLEVHGVKLPRQLPRRPRAVEVTGIREAPG